MCTHAAPSRSVPGCLCSTLPTLRAPRCAALQAYAQQVHSPSDAITFGGFVLLAYVLSDFATGALCCTLCFVVVGVQGPQARPQQHSILPGWGGVGRGAHGQHTATSQASSGCTRASGTAPVAPAAAAHAPDRRVESVGRHMGTRILGALPHPRYGPQGCHAASRTHHHMHARCAGVYHWSVDNYGDGSTPVFGRQIAAFQGHHQRPWTITQREFCNNVHQVGLTEAWPPLNNNRGGGGGRRRTGRPHRQSCLVHATYVPPATSALLPARGWQAAWPSPYGPCGWRETAGLCTRLDPVVRRRLRLSAR
jgi:hypothetical protein